MNIDSKERYGRISKFFHWSTTVLIFWQLLKFTDRISDGKHWIGQTLVLGMFLLVFYCSY